MEDGYIVIPSSAPVDWLVALFDESVSHYPDLQLDNLEIAPVGGGFSALANPYSFHNKATRDIRRIYIHDVRDYLHTLFTDENTRIENLIDRTVHRPPGVKPTSESWHRDASENPVDFATDIIFGGWMNTSRSPQFFSCVPGTHNDPLNGMTGFAKIGKSEHASLKQRRRLVEVPPGSILLFNEKLIHEVLARPYKHWVNRVHMGFAITARQTPMVVDIQERLQQGAVIPLKSGQIPPMYPELWRVNWMDKLVAFSDQIGNTQVKETLKRKRSGEEYPGIVKRHMPSLVELHVPFTPYDDDEINLYIKPY